MALSHQQDIELKTKKAAVLHKETIYKAKEKIYVLLFLFIVFLMSFFIYSLFFMKKFGRKILVNVVYIIVCNKRMLYIRVY